MFGKGSFLRKKSEDESSSETRALSKTSGEISTKPDNELSSESHALGAIVDGLRNWNK